MKDSKGAENREYPAALSEYINKFQELTLQRKLEETMIICCKDNP